MKERYENPSQSEETTGTTLRLTRTEARRFMLHHHGLAPATGRPGYDPSGAVPKRKKEVLDYISQSSIAINEDCDVLSFFMVNLARKARFAIVIV